MTSPSLETDALDADDYRLLPEEQEDLSFPASDPAEVVYSGQDFDIHGLVRRLDQHDIIIPQFGSQEIGLETAAFQRGFVWNRPQMDRFIESLLLGFPIPGIFLVKQKDSRLLVLDGQQRLKTLQFFYSTSFNDRTYRLVNVADRFKGKAYVDLDATLRRSLDNSFIQATIVTARPEADNMNAIYQIFERLNSGGTQLTAHEIRVALYAGPIIAFLESLNTSEHWRSLYGKKNQRIRDQELIARIIALFLGYKGYSRPLKTFINNFLEENKEEVSAEALEAGELFLQASEILDRVIGRVALRRASRQVNNAWTDALYVGLMTRLQSSSLTDESVRETFEALRDNDDYQQWVTGPSADEDLVLGRMGFATKVFAEA